MEINTYQVGISGLRSPPFSPTKGKTGDDDLESNSTDVTLKMKSSKDKIGKGRSRDSSEETSRGTIVQPEDFKPT